MTEMRLGLKSDIKFLRDTLERDIAKNGAYESFMIRSGFLKEILDVAEEKIRL